MLTLEPQLSAMPKKSALKKPRFGSSATDSVSSEISAKIAAFQQNVSDRG